MRQNPRLVVALIIGAFVLGGCGGGSDSKSEPTAEPKATAFPTAEMVPAIQDLVTRANAGPGDSIEISGCPLGDFAALVAAGPAEVIALDAAAVDPIVTYVFQTDVAGELAFLQCGRDEVGAYTGEVKDGDYQQGIINVLPDFITTFDADRAYEGGTIVRFCADPIGVGDGAFCEADWYDGNIWMGVFMAGDAQSTELAEQWLLAILADVVANVPALAPVIHIGAVSI